MALNNLLEELLSISVQKSNALIDIVRQEGMSYSDEYVAAKAAFEAAEKRYSVILKMSEGSKSRP